jgi:NADPH2:quinone reductase
MRAMAIEAFGGADRLRPMALPRPRAGRGEILIRVVAAGVNPVDWKIREGQLRDQFPHQFPLVPGWDAAGVVEEIGEGAAGFRKGDRVWAYARKPTVQWGCYAEYVAVPEAAVALMPARLLFEEAAAVPLAALTAHQCLTHRPEAGPGRSVLIHAAAGGVGHFAVQLAKIAGARVVGTASGAHRAFVLALGADADIDHTAEDFREAAKRLGPGGFDLVLDAVGGDTLARSYGLVKPGGRLVSIVGPPDAAAAASAGITAHFLFVEPDGEQLRQLARLVDQKKLAPHVQKIYPLAEAAEAQRASEAGHVGGKLVLNI